MNYIEIISLNYPLVQCHISGDPSIYENLVWDAGDSIPAKNVLDALDLSTRQNSVWEQIKEYRNIQYNNGVLVSGKWFHTDESSKIKYLGLLMMGVTMPNDINWKTMDGTFVHMTPVLIQAIFAAVSEHENDCFQNAETHRTNILASSNPEAYDYTTGWPDKYQ